jgi:hypothetical protein
VERQDARRASLVNLATWIVLLGLVVGVIALRQSAG